MFDADFEPVRTMQSAWEKVHALRRRAQEEEVRFCLYERHEEAERTGEKQKKKLSGVRKNIGRKKRLNRGKEIGKMKGRRIYGNISRGIVGRTEKTAK